MRTLLPAAACGLVLAFGCDNAKKDKAEADQAAPAQAESTAEKPGGETELKIEGPVAKVNDVEITADQFLEQYNATLKRYERSRSAVQPSLRERLKDNVVRRLVDAELIRQQAKRLGVKVDPAEFATRWAEHKAKFGDEAAFKSFLEKAGTTEKLVEDQFRLTMLREKVFAKLGSVDEPTEAELKAYYERNQARYNQPEQLRASHILFRVTPSTSPEEKAKIRANAEKVLKEVKASPKRFAELAKQYGQDPTRDKGGDLGFFPRGRMVKAFEEVAWKLKNGQVSNLVETNFGFHIIQRTGYTPPKTRKYDEVKDTIVTSVKTKKSNEKIREALKKWRDESKIEIFVKGDPEIIKSGSFGRRSPMSNGVRPNIQGRAGIVRPTPTLTPKNPRTAKANLKTVGKLPPPSTKTDPQKQAPVEPR